MVFQSFSRKSCTKFDGCDEALSWTNIQSSHLTSFLIAGNNVFFLMFTIILFIYFNTIFIHKKSFVAPYQEIAAETISFPDILLVDANKFSSGTSDIFPFLYTWSFCMLIGTSRVKSFSSYHTVFSIMLVLHSNFSANAMAWAYLLLWHPSFISGVFTLLSWWKCSSFYHSSNWWMTDSSLFGHFTKC